MNENHRNTREIAAFASGILRNVVVDNDGTIPNLNAAVSSGSLPKVILGKYSEQLSWTLNFIRSNVNLKVETVAFLKPWGRAWFDTLKKRLFDSGINFVDMQGNQNWPKSDENVAISTFHSAKGLEFDHVFILGFNQVNTPFGDENSTDQVQVLRRLLGVAVVRARKQVVIGYKPGEGSRLAGYFERDTFMEIRL